MENVLEALSIIVALFVGIAGIFFAHNFRRQVKLKTADGRTASYSALYAIMHVASPVRLEAYYEGPVRGPLSKDERMNLYESFTEWYFAKGNGMFLSDRTRRLYFAAKHNLICRNEELQLSGTFGIRLESAQFSEDKRGELSIRQLSLLRARMRADLEVYGSTYLKTLTDEDKAFLMYCGEDPEKPPWKCKDCTQSSITG